MQIYPPEEFYASFKEGVKTGESPPFDRCGGDLVSYPAVGRETRQFLLSIESRGAGGMFKCTLLLKLVVNSTASK